MSQVTGIDEEAALRAVFKGLVLVEPGEVVVKTADYVAARTGDAVAAEQLRAALDGLVTYTHAIPVADDETVVNVADLVDMGPDHLDVVEAVTVHTRRVPG